MIEVKVGHNHVVVKYPHREPFIIWHLEEALTFLQELNAAINKAWETSK